MWENGPVEGDVREFLAENFPLGRDVSELSSSDSLLEAGVIDSTGVMELVGFLEETYGIQVDDQDLLPENLDSIENIVRYVTEKLAQGSAHDESATSAMA